MAFVLNEHCKYWVKIHWCAQLFIAHMHFIPLIFVYFFLWRTDSIDVDVSHQVSKKNGQLKYSSKLCSRQEVDPLIDWSATSCIEFRILSLKSVALVHCVRNAFSCTWSNTWQWLQQQRPLIRSHDRSKADVFWDHAVDIFRDSASFFLFIHPQQTGFSSLELTSHSHWKTVSALNITVLFSYVQDRDVGNLFVNCLSGCRFLLRSPLLPTSSLSFPSQGRAIVPFLNSL